MKENRLRRPARAARSKEWTGYLFILPQVLGFSIFGLLPLVANLVLAFYRWDILTPAKFIGLANFSKLVHDEVFLNALLNSIQYSAMYVLPCLVVSLGLAVLLNQRVRGMGFFRTVYYLPVVTSYVVATIVWRWLFDYNIGPFNQWLSYLHIPPVPWLVDTQWAIPSLVLMAIWKNCGYSVLIYLAGLQNIPRECQEAAQIDGGNAVQVFRYVTWPLLRPTTFLLTVMLTIWSFQAFAQPYLMTSGGPARATETLVYFIYQQGFSFYTFGYSALAALVMMALVFLITGVLQRFSEGGTAHPFSEGGTA